MGKITFMSLLVSVLIVCGAIILIKFIIYLFTDILGLKIRRVVHLVGGDLDEEIKIPIEPCPFCGKNVSEVFEQPGDSEDETLYSVVCDIHHGGCGCSTGIYKDPISALRGWNRRSYDQ